MSHCSSLFKFRMGVVRRPKGNMRLCGAKLVMIVRIIGGRTVVCKFKEEGGLVTQNGVLRNIALMGGKWWMHFSLEP